MSGCQVFEERSSALVVRRLVDLAISRAENGDLLVMDRPSRLLIPASCTALFVILRHRFQVSDHFVHGVYDLIKRPNS